MKEGGAEFPYSHIRYLPQNNSQDQPAIPSSFSFGVLVEPHLHIIPEIISARADRHPHRLREISLNSFPDMGMRDVHVFGDS